MPPRRHPNDALPCNLKSVKWELGSGGLMDMGLYLLSCIQVPICHYCLLGALSEP